MLDRKWRWVRGWREEAEWARGVCVCAHVYVYPSVCVIEKQGWLGGGGRRLSGGEVCVCVSIHLCRCVIHACPVWCIYMCVCCVVCVYYVWVYVCWDVCCV